MGKLLGLPMGVDVCHTNHMAADQNDLENLAVLLAAAGCNYIMAVPMGDDCMLSYQTSSFHDAAALRELLDRPPRPGSPSSAITPRRATPCGASGATPSAIACGPPDSSSSPRPHGIA